MSENSTNEISVRKLFDEMEYGQIKESKSLGEAWLMENVNNFGLFIDGELRKSPQSNTSQSKSTGVNFSTSFLLNEESDYCTAFQSSSSACPKWASYNSHARATILYSIARQLQKHTTLLSELEALNRGVQVSNAREHDIPALIRIFYYYAGWAQLLETEFTSWKPCGPVIGMTSSSSPLSSLAFLVAPALASGNTITLLPHVSNCLSAFFLAQLCSASGLPPGVVNVVPQDFENNEKCSVLASGSITAKKIAVIGSASLGRNILGNCEMINQKNLMLLNGGAPMVVLDSADLDAAVDCVIDAAWINQGQDPWALKMLVVQESVYASFKCKLTERVNSLKIGASFEKMADVSDSSVNGALAKKLQEILSSDPCSDVVQPHDASSLRWAPTVIFSAAPSSAPVLAAFDDVSPVLQVVSARSAKEAITIANHCGGGVAASIWTESLAFAWESSLQLKASTVWINSFGTMDACIPISGRNSSGSGCFLGREGLLEFLQPRDIPINFMKVSPSISTSLVPAVPGDVIIDQTYKLFYGGGHKRPSSNTYRTVLNGSQVTVAVIPESNRKDVRNAVEAAVKAQPGWWKRGGHNRAQIIFNLAEKLQARRSHFANTLQAIYLNDDANESSKEVDEAVELLFHFAAICDKVVQSSSQIVGGMTVHVMREPLGVVAVALSSSAGNALAGLIALIGAAIAYGNACVIIIDLKCATPALELAQILETAEVPAGVINILSGDANGLLPTISGHMDISTLWSVGMQEGMKGMIEKESSKSNMKQSWVMEYVASPLELRQTYEMKASQTKAIWLSGLASFGA